MGKIVRRYGNAYIRPVSKILATYSSLSNICHVLEAISSEVITRENVVSHKTLNTNKITSSKAKQVLIETQLKFKCHVCGENHKLHNCESFKAMSHNEKTESIKKAGLCFNCFRANHKVNECRASSCKKCERRHHTMLHSVKSGNVTLSVEQEVEHSKEQGLTQKTVTQSLNSRLKDTSQFYLQQTSWMHQVSIK